jgi:transcriptional regulator with XRE-family HTH domain
MAGPPEPTAAAILEHRTSLGLSQVKYARLIGVNRSTLREWESGAYKPIRRRHRLLEVLAMGRQDALAEHARVEARHRTRIAQGAAASGVQVGLVVLFQVEPDVTAEILIRVRDWANDPVPSQQAAEVLSLLGSLLRQLGDQHGWRVRMRYPGARDGP